MPRFRFETLFADGDLRLTRSTCDGCDAPRPAPEQPFDDCISVVLSGRYALRDRGGRAVADPTRSTIFRRDREVVVTHPHGEGDVCLNVRGSLLAPLFEHDAATVPLTVAGQVILARLAARLAARKPADRLWVDEALVRALVPDPQPARPTSRADRAIAEAIQYLVGLRFDEPLALATVAAQAGVSPFHASRAFRRATGTTIHRYQQELRLRHALSLLVDGARPLVQVALLCGFANQGHLGNRFRRRFGVTPGQARRAGLHEVLPPGAVA